MKRKKPNQYYDVKVDSEWERKLLEGVLKDLIYHPPRIEYTVEHKYQPDWKHFTVSKTIYIEAKGRFRTSEESAKYVWIRKQLKEYEELVFLFMNPNLPLPNAKKRKDGSKRTHADWANKNGFRWFTEESIGDIL